MPMTTSQIIIDRATSLLRVRSSGSSFADDDANGNADAFVALQHLISEWTEDNKLSIPAPALVTDTLEVSAGSMRALAYNLAVELESDFGAVLSRSDYNTAKETKDRLIRKNSIDIEADLSGVPTMRGHYNIETDE